VSGSLIGRWNASEGRWIAEPGREVQYAGGYSYLVPRPLRARSGGLLWAKLADERESSGVEVPTLLTWPGDYTQWDDSSGVYRKKTSGTRDALAH